MKIPNADIKLEEDPYRQVGYGINAYFDLTVQLSWMFCVMTIVMLPTMYIFSTMAGVKDISILYALDAYTLGNMGGSSVLCNNAPLMVPGIQLGLECPSGTLNMDATA